MFPDTFNANDFRCNKCIFFSIETIWILIQEDTNYFKLEMVPLWIFKAVAQVLLSLVTDLEIW